MWKDLDPYPRNCEVSRKRVKDYSAFFKKRYGLGTKKKSKRCFS